MPTGIHANEIHTDITNHFLGMGVIGGLPLMLLFILVLIAAFRAVGQALRRSETASVKHRFLAWTLGAILFGHTINFFAISLFDQSIVFFYVVLAAIGAIQRGGRRRSCPTKVDHFEREDGRRGPARRN
jgi:O-antigen ligase